MKKIIIAALFSVPLLATAASTLSTHLRTDGKEVQAAFASAADSAKKCTVQVYNGAKFVGLGTVVTEDGLVLAKNSEFSTVREGQLRIMGPGRRIARARILARDIPHDLVILDLGRKVELGYEWGDTKDLSLGTWLVSGATGSITGPKVRGGVLAAKSRTIKKSGGVIGVILGGRDGEENGGVQVTEVAKDGPAFKAGLKKNDIIFAIDGKEVFEREKMIEIVKSNDPGTVITVSLKRGNEELDVDITLGYRNIVFADMKSRNDKMSGKFSVRRTGFETVLQHDITLGPSDMGGPLFDLKGRLVGINIAKANRVEFFAIPVEAIKKVLKEKASEIAKARGLE